MKTKGNLKEKQGISLIVLVITIIVIIILAAICAVIFGTFKLVKKLQDTKTKEAFDCKLRLGYQIYKKALQKGVLLRPLGDVIYFNPPLIIDENDMDFVTDVAIECTKEVLGV